MKRFIVSLIVVIGSWASVAAQGWPQQYGGVMLQGFYWDSYIDTQWSGLEAQSDELSRYFNLIWIPQSGYCGSGNNMGYTPQYYFRQNSSFGSEEALRSMIKTFKEKGTGMIADVVINHRNNIGDGGSWVDYPAEVYKGVTYQMLPSDICANDDGGKTKSWASQKGITLSQNNDTGDDWDGCRDIDHKSENVNKVVKAYLKYLKEDLGYTGFRYDMVKGYSASFTGDYNKTTGVEYSVGEYWDGNANTVNNWINGTKVDGVIQSAAFDFAFRYTCRDAVNQNNWSKLTNVASATNSVFSRYAVTFVENHDTEYRSSTAQQDPIRKDTLALNAWLMANPGTPCVFLKHWQAYKHEIKLMIEARKHVGVTNQSGYSNLSGTNTTYCAREIKGKNGSLIVVVGQRCNDFVVPTGFKEILSGYHYRYLVSQSLDNATWKEIVARIEKEDEKAPFEAHKATVYVNADFTPLYFYVWDSNNNAQLNGNWPGKVQSATTEIGGKTWYYQTFDINKEDYFFNIIFNQGNGKPQTTDIGKITTDKFFIAKLSGSTVTYQDVTSQYQPYLGVLSPVIEKKQNSNVMYNLSGMRVKKGYKGIVIINGKKRLP